MRTTLLASIFFLAMFALWIGSRIANASEVSWVHEWCSSTQDTAGRTPES